MPAAEAGATSARAESDVTTTDPLGPDSMREFSPPYASAGSHTSAPVWTESDDGNGWTGKKIAMAGLTLGGVAAVTYVMRRRMRRKTPLEQVMDMATDFLGSASDFASQRHPAWWASLAAAALPIAYFAWPSTKPTSTKPRSQVDDMMHRLEGYLAGASGRPPWATGRMMGRSMPMGRLMPMAWKMASPRGMGRGWSPSMNVPRMLGALALGGLVVYLVRRATAKAQPDARIADVMTRRPRVIQPEATVADAASMMRRLDVGALPVCDGTRLVGMLTDRDITVRSTADGRDPHLTPVRDIMSPGVAWATEDDPVAEAARIMREHRIRRLPIVDERHSLVGVVSLGDLAVDVADDSMSGDTLEHISEPSRASRRF